MENVTLSNASLTDLLPTWMKRDDFDKALAESVSYYAKDMAANMKVMSKWADEAIDTMSEQYLDLLAYELDVTWYLYDADIDQKRSIIKNARKVHWKLGTKWAIEQVLAVYFTSATVEEWYEYDGEPGHFRINSAFSELYENDESFLTVLNTVKRYSQILDTVQLVNEIKLMTYHGSIAQSRLKNVFIISTS